MSGKGRSCSPLCGTNLTDGSVGTESTFRDMSDPVELREKLKRTANELEKDMKRAECKGRTLVLKVKLHTFEVLTRQVVLPKAIYLADDLYKYALPMLGKLEKEKPGMKLRLMGLRCTNLQSTKPPDTMAFFGLRPRRTESGESSSDKNLPYGEDEWEQWPEELLNEDRHGNRKSSETQEGDAGGSPFRRHGKEVVPNPKKEVEEEELWDCPICGRPQAADEKQFNEHIDLCLSRRAIKDVQQDVATQTTQTTISKTSTPDSSRKAKKRGRQPAPSDPKQKKLCFG